MFYFIRSVKLFCGEREVYSGIRCPCETVDEASAATRDAEPLSFWFESNFIRATSDWRRDEFIPCRAIEEA